MASQGVRTGFVAAALLLAGCGSNQQDQEDRFDSEVIRGTGSAGEQAQAGDDAAASLPPGITPYPDAQVTSASVIAAQGGRGVIMVMQTADAPDQVIAFYRAQAEEQGVTIRQQAQTDTTTAFNGDGPQGLGISVSAAAGPGGQTIVQLTAGRDD